MAHSPKRPATRKSQPSGTPFRSGIAGGQFSSSQAQHPQREAVEDEIDGHEQADDKKAGKRPGPPDPDTQGQIDDAVTQDPKPMLKLPGDSRKKMKNPVQNQVKGDQQGEGLRGANGTGDDHETNRNIQQTG